MEYQPDNQGRIFTPEFKTKRDRRRWLKKQTPELRQRLLVQARQDRRRATAAAVVAKRKLGLYPEPTEEQIQKWKETARRAWALRRQKYPPNGTPRKYGSVKKAREQEKQQTQEAPPVAQA